MEQEKTTIETRRSRFSTRQCVDKDTSVVCCRFESVLSGYKYRECFRSIDLSFLWNSIIFITVPFLRDFTRSGMDQDKHFELVPHICAQEGRHACFGWTGR